MCGPTPKKCVHLLIVCAAIMFRNRPIEPETRRLAPTTPPVHPKQQIPRHIPVRESVFGYF